MRKGTLKPNALAIASLEADFINPPTGKMTAKAAFVNLETGATHGWTTHQTWSPSTIQKLRELKDAMEADMAAAHFLEAGIEEPGGITMPATSSRVVSPGGLGEHLDSQGEDAESIA